MWETVAQIRRSLEISYLALDSTSLMSTNRLGFGIMDLAELQGDPSQQPGMRRGSFEAKLKKTLKKKRREEIEDVERETAADGMRLCARCGGFSAAGWENVADADRKEPGPRGDASTTVVRAFDSDEFEDRPLVRSCTTIEGWHDARSPAQLGVDTSPTRHTVGATAGAAEGAATDSSTVGKLPGIEGAEVLRTQAVLPTEGVASRDAPARHPCRCALRREASSSTSMADSADSSSDSDMSSNSTSTSSDDVTRSSWASSSNDGDTSRSASDTEIPPAPAGAFGSFQPPGVTGGPQRSLPSAALFRYPSKESRWARRHRRRASRNRRRKATAAASAKGDDATAAAAATSRSESGVFGNTHTKGTVRR